MNDSLIDSKIGISVDELVVVYIWSVVVLLLSMIGSWYIKMIDMFDKGSSVGVKRVF
jgi:hypothetical protein